MSLTPEARQRYSVLYLGELNDSGHGERIGALIERRAPMTLRIAMLLALCDLTTEVTVAHLNAAMAWVRFGVESVKFIFASADDEAELAKTNEVAEKIIKYLKDKRESTPRTSAAIASTGMSAPSALIQPLPSC